MSHTKKGGSSNMPVTAPLYTSHEQMLDAAIEFYRDPDHDRAVDDGNCVYYVDEDPINKRCAVGCLIPTTYDPLIPFPTMGASAEELFEELPQIKALFAENINSRFIRQMQGAHDMACRREEVVMRLQDLRMAAQQLDAGVSPWDVFEEQH